MTKYLDKSFSVNMPSTQKWRDNWDAIFVKHKDRNGNPLKVGDIVTAGDSPEGFIVISLESESLVVLECTDGTPGGMRPSEQLCLQVKVYPLDAEPE